MFTMDVPYIPVLDTPIILAQAAVTSGAGNVVQQPGYLLTGCKEIPTLSESTSAERGIDPAGMVAVEIGNLRNHDIYGDKAVMGAIKVTMLESPKHGKLIPNTSGSGRIYYMYFINDTESGYLGKDKAVFMVEFEGKSYKVVFNMTVGPVEAVGESTCPIPTLIKLKSKPASGSSGYDFNSVSNRWGQTRLICNILIIFNIL